MNNCANNNPPLPLTDPALLSHVFSFFKRGSAELSPVICVCKQWYTASHFQSWPRFCGEENADYKLSQLTARIDFMQISAPNTNIFYVTGKMQGVRMDDRKKITRPSQEKIANALSREGEVRLYDSSVLACMYAGCIHQRQEHGKYLPIFKVQIQSDSMVRFDSEEQVSKRNDTLQGKFCGYYDDNFECGKIDARKITHCYSAYIITAPEFYKNPVRHTFLFANPALPSLEDKKLNEPCEEMKISL